MMPPYGTPPPYAAMYAQGTPYQQAPMPPVVHLLHFTWLCIILSSFCITLAVSTSGLTPIRPLSCSSTKWDSSNSCKLLVSFSCLISRYFSKVYSSSLSAVLYISVLVTLLSNLLTILLLFICCTAYESFVQFSPSVSSILDIWCWRVRGR